MALSKDEFNWVWKDTSREGILNQFYSDYVFTQKLKEDINKAIKYINENGIWLDIKDFQEELINILKGEEQ